ncbi:hypothetical protein [Cytobacillus kochii]
MDINLKHVIKNLLRKEEPNQIVQDFKRFINYNSNQIKFNWHPLGFVHSKICSIPKIGDLRLHIWLGENRKTQLPYMPIHDHVFNVNSFILTGNVTNKVYEIGNATEDLYRKYEATYINGDSILYPTKELLNCNLKNSTIHSKGTFYTVPKGVFHESMVDEGEFASTLVIATDKDETIKPYILGPVKSEKFFYRRDTCSEPIIKMLNKKI